MIAGLELLIFPPSVCTSAKLKPRILRVIYYLMAAAVNQPFPTNLIDRTGHALAYAARTSNLLRAPYSVSAIVDSPFINLSTLIPELYFQVLSMSALSSSILIIYFLITGSLPAATLAYVCNFETLGQLSYKESTLQSPIYVIKNPGTLAGVLVVTAKRYLLSDTLPGLGMSRSGCGRRIRHRYGLPLARICFLQQT